MEEKNSVRKQKASVCYKSGFAFISLSYSLGFIALDNFFQSF